MRMSWEELLFYWEHIEKVQKGIVTAQFKDDTCNVTETAETTVVAFDGSSTFKEWVGNLRALPLKQGFHKNFYKTAFGFYEILKTNIDKNKEITVTGTSRGGSVAIIFAWILKRLGYNVKCITFVQPKVATKKAHKQLVESGLEVHRVIAGRDIVDNIPPFFKHYQSELYRLGTVRGKLDHTALRKALENKIKEE